ncbi:RNA-guided endonuclease TnpB family protein [Halorhodospira neutriphila]|uniref:Cas12f1-like TNB domain-containing protein n=1 Tax=Halorhodospira neutriphila TaxID=168379 RepID=A0ABS1E3X9_9GAMM|nr:hypothetical protein [Halorhodospira neutriphila]
MPRQPTPTFVHELPLVVTPGVDRVLETRLHAARQVFNATLGEGLRRMDLLRESRAWRRALDMPKGRARNETLWGLRQEAGLSDSELQQVARTHWHAGGFRERLDTHVVQKLGTRAWKAIEEHLYNKRGRPRFKGARRFRTIEGKSNAAGLRFRDGAVEWKGLKLPVRIDPKDKHGVEAHALASRVKHVRLVRRTMKGRVRWFAQLVLQGTPWQKAKNKVACGQEVGLDIGPSTIAAVGDDDAFLARFCDELEPLGREIRRIQRAMDRSRRATNPDNYHPDGTVKEGCQHWIRSRRYRSLSAKLAELQRKQAATRKRAHGSLANQVLALGNIIKTEALSYQGFQRSFGKSVRDRAPGMFIERLRRKAANAGGQVIEFPTQSTRLSQACVCGAVRKKPLSARWHHCECGVSAQRDLFSAFLARHVEDHCLSMSQAQSAWAGAEPLLGRAMERLNQAASGSGSAPASFGLAAYRRQSCSPAKGESAAVEAPDGVPKGASPPGGPGRGGCLVTRTPRL